MPATWFSVGPPGSAPRTEGPAVAVQRYASAKLPTHAHTHVSMAQDKSCVCRCTRIFTISKTAENSAEVLLLLLESQAPTWPGAALASGVGLILSEWHPVEISAPSGLCCKRREACCGKQEFVYYKQTFTTADVVLEYQYGSTSDKKKQVLAGDFF